MSRVAAAGRADVSVRKTSSRAPRGYFHCSELPLTSLLFLLPLIVFYEIGTWQYAYDPVHHTEQRIIAFTMMRQFFQLFGATGRYLPAFAVVVLLLSWHVARRDAWQIQIPHLLGMLLESALLAIPLMAIGFVFARYLPLMGWTHQKQSLLVLSIGAGIYEELVFRLMSFTVLSLVLIDVLRLNRAWSHLLMVFLSALLFSLYHYLGNEPFGLRAFLFRTGAGLYFGALFVFRGFGITAGSHAAYDALVVFLRGAV